MLASVAGPHHARLDVVRDHWPAQPGDRLVAHLMVDAPLHRRGETLQGRVVLREVVASPLPALAGAADAALALRAPPPTPFLLRFWPGTAESLELAASSDPDGVVAFELPLPESAPLGELRLDVVRADAGADARALLVAHPCVVAAVKRPPLLLDVGWPEEGGGDARPVVRVTASLPSGVAAAGLRGTLRVEADPPRHDETHRFALDATGRAELPIACDAAADSLPSRLVLRLTLTLVAPDGQLLIERGELRWGPRRSAATAATAARRLGDASDAAAAPAPLDRLELRRLTAAPEAGAPLELEIAGPARERVLLTVGRAQALVARRVDLDERGRARVELEAPLAWWPRVEARVRAFDRDDGELTGWWCHSDEVVLELAPPRSLAPVAATLVEAGATFEPGATVTLHLETRTPDGTPQPAQVAVAIVDESLFLLGKDRTPAPHRAMLPQPAWSFAGGSQSAVESQPRTILGELFRDGSLEGRGGFLRPSMGGGGATAGPGATANAALRDDLRAIAAFLPCVRTDAHGRGRFTVTLPHDLARWRVTMAVVSERFGGALTSAHVTTARAHHVTLLAPRFLREGDVVDLPAVAGTTLAAPREVVVAASAGRGLALESVAQWRAQLSAAVPARVSWRVRATQAGEGSLAARLLEAAADPHELDGERRTLPVHPAAIARTSVATGRLVGGATLRLRPPPIEGAAPHELRVTVLADRRALLAEASQWLGAYPWGCAEQTISRLVPFLAAARARRAMGIEGPPLAPEQAERVERGMARLRSLHDGGGFAWWPGHEVDWAMTPVVVQGLALARDAGIDPAAQRAWPDLARGLPGHCAEAVAAAHGDPAAAWRALPAWRSRELRGAQHVAELAVALLLAQPEHMTARAAVGALVRAAAPLSASLLVRAGLALHGAGDREGALAAWQRDRTPARTGVAAPACLVPLEDDPLVLAAHRLDLARRVGRPAQEQDALAGELLGGFAEGRFGTTWATALALCALAEPVAPAEASAEVGAEVNAAAGEIVVRAGGAERRLEPGANGRARLALAVGVDGDTAVELVARGQVDAVVLVACEWHVPAGAAGAWAEPIVVAREAWRIEVVDGRERRVALVRRDGVLHCAVGDVVESEVTVRSPDEIGYAFVHAPLPAGVEAVVLGGRARGERLDDAIVHGLPRLAAFETVHLRDRFVAGHAGRMVWPGARAEAMYRPERSGACASESLEIAPAAAFADAVPTWFLPEARALPPRELQVHSARSDREERPEPSALSADLAAWRDEIPPWRRFDDAVRRAVAGGGGVRGLPLDPGGLAELAELGRVVRRVREEIAAPRPPRELCELAAELLDAGEPPSFEGAAPFEAERELERALEELRAEWIAALLRALADPDAPFDALDVAVAVVDAVPEASRQPIALRLLDEAARRRDRESLAQGGELLEALEEEVALATPLGGRIVEWLRVDRSSPLAAWRDAAWSALASEERERVPGSLRLALGEPFEVVDEGVLDDDEGDAGDAPWILDTATDLVAALAAADARMAEVRARGRHPRVPRELLAALSPQLLRDAWQPWQEWRARANRLVDSSERELLAEHEVALTGVAAQWIDDDGREQHAAPSTPREWRDAVQARSSWLGSLPGDDTESRELSLALDRWLRERGLWAGGE